MPGHLLLVHIAENLVFTLPANQQAALSPFGMASDMDVVQGKTGAIGANGARNVDAFAALAVPSASYEEVDTIAIPVPERVVDDRKQAAAYCRF